MGAGAQGNDKEMYTRQDTGPQEVKALSKKTGNNS